LQTAIGGRRPRLGVFEGAGIGTDVPHRGIALLRRRGGLVDSPPQLLVLSLKHVNLALRRFALPLMGVNFLGQCARIGDTSPKILILALKTVQLPRQGVALVFHRPKAIARFAGGLL